MTERKLSPKNRVTRNWIVAGVVGLFLLSTLVTVALALPSSSVGVVGSPTPFTAFSGSPCTLTIYHETAGNNAVQSAINTYGPLSSPSSPVTICLGPGTFPEQLTINNTVDLSLVGSGNTSTLLVPTAVGPNGVDLDTLLPAYAVIGAWDDAGLTISNVGVSGASALASVEGNCAAQFYGVYFGNTSGSLSASSVTGISSDGGCQGQSAVYADTGWFETAIVNPQAVQVVGNTVTGFGKNGVTCDGVGLTCEVMDNTVSTTPMPYGYAATNGIQFWGATGEIQSNQVNGNYYYPGSCLEQNYFSSSAGCLSPYWSGGILVISPPTTVDVSSNVLSDNQVGIWSLGGPTVASGNTVTGGGYYGIVLDFSVADAGGPSAIYTSGAYVGTAESNQISDQNVGILAYDDNATIVSNAFESVNVSIEVATDTSVPSVDEVSSNVGDVNVSGALLGDISSFQTGVSATPTGTYVVGGNTFTNDSGPGSTAQGSGIALYGASANLNGNTITGFPTGISAVVGPTGDVTASDNSVTAPVPAIPATGIYLFADTATVQGNIISGFSWMNGPGWWPNSQATGLFVQCLETCTISENSLDNNAIGIGVVSYSYGPFPAPDWPFAAAPSEGPIAISDNTVTNSGAFGIALELNQQTSSETAAPSVTVTGNMVDNTLSGAVGLMVDQGTYTITGNTFVGTSATGSSGSSQPTGEGAIGTASIQVLDASDSATAAYAGDNTFVDTTLYFAVLNVTTAPPYFAAVIGDPALTPPTTPSVSATALDADQALTVTGTIPSTGVLPYSWTWLVSMNGGAYSTATECATDSGTGALAGLTVACAISGGTLLAGSYYNFELQVTDNATTPVTQTSPASETVTVSSTLTAPTAPSVSATALDVDQVLTVTGTVPLTGTSPVSWTWLVSVGGGGYAPATQCAANTGTGSGPFACLISGGTLTVGATYAFELTVTDGATVMETQTSPASETVTVASALTAPGAPTVSATALDVDQALTVTGTVPLTGTLPVTWTWLVSVNGGPYVAATQCAVGSGTGSGPVTCSISGGTLTVGAAYAFELTVTDSATAMETQTSTASSTVTVASALTAPRAPTLNRPALDLNQALTVRGKIPSTGTSPYSWTWLVSVNSGPYGAATQCATNSGSGALASATETCSIAANTLAAGNYYKFELKVGDSATTSEAKTSAASKTVMVASALTAPGAPGVSATKLDVDQTLTVTGTIPSTGTAPYGWEWLISANGAAYDPATQCAFNSGSGASAGSTVTCSIAGNTLAAGNYYKFELKVGDSATKSETKTSAASAKITVKSELAAPGTPTVSKTTLTVTHTLTVKDKTPTTGTGPYAWQWLVSVNAGGFAPAIQCTTNSGTGGGAGSTVTCTVPGNTLTIGDTYVFELKVTDSATAAETQTSAASKTVTVAI